MCKPLAVLVRLVPVLVASLALAALPSAAQEASDTPDAPLYREIMRWGETDRSSPGWRRWDQVEWSPDGERIAALGWSEGSSRLFIWDARTGEELVTFDQMSIYGFDWSPDGLQIAGVTHDGSNLVIYIWNSVTGEVTNTIVWTSDREGTRAYVIDWSPDGRFLATTGHDLVAWDLDDESSQSLHRYWEGGTDIAWSPDSQKLAAVGVNSIEVGVPGVTLPQFGGQ
jgi:WD40 repeat protein